MERILDLSFLFLISYLELYRAHKIMVQKKTGYFTGFQTSMVILQLLGFANLTKILIKNAEKPNNQKSSAIFGLIVGTIGLLFGFYTIYVNITNL